MKKKIVLYEKLSKKKKREKDSMKRLDWGQVKPYTRVERDRKKYTRKQKHKGRTEE